MHAKQTIAKIQRELTQMKIAGANADIDDWLWDHIYNIQEAINEYNNAWAKPFDPDPFA